MGITNLGTLIKEYAPNSIRDVKDLSEFDLWRVGCDASLSIYQLCSVGNKLQIKNKQGKLINHIQGIFFRTLKMILSGMHPVYIFDGKPPEMKGETITERKAARDAGTGVRVPKEVFIEVMKLLDLMGILCIQAPGEAEAQIVSDTHIGNLDAAATNDLDALAFGAKYVITGLDATAKKVKIIDREQMLKDLMLTQEQFVNLCILLGCDYTGTLPGIGYKRAYTLIKKYGNIENILKGEKINPPENFNYNGARNLFMNPEVGRSKYDAEIKKLTATDIDKLRDYLINVHGLEPSRVNKSLLSLEKFHDIKK